MCQGVLAIVGTAGLRRSNRHVPVCIVLVHYTYSYIVYVLVYYKYDLYMFVYNLCMYVYVYMGFVCVHCIFILHVIHAYVFYENFFLFIEHVERIEHFLGRYTSHEHVDYFS